MRSARIVCVAFLIVGAADAFVVRPAEGAILRIEYGSTLSPGSMLNRSPVGAHGHAIGTSFTMRAVFNTAVDLDPSLGSVPSGMGVFAAQSVQFDLVSYGTVTAAPGSLNVFFRNLAGVLVETGIRPTAGGIETFRVGLGVSPALFNPDAPIAGVFGTGIGSFQSATTIPLVGGGSLAINGLVSSFSSVTITQVPEPVETPEPSSLVLVACAGVTLAGWCRKQRSSRRAERQGTT